jgi:hypothetical protein
LAISCGLTSAAAATDAKTVRLMRVISPAHFRAMETVMAALQAANLKAQPVPRNRH